MPDAIADPVSQLPIHFPELVVDTGQAEVVDPALLHLFKLLDPLIKSLRAGFTGNGFEISFELLPPFLTHRQSVFAFVPFLERRRKPVA